MDYTGLESELDPDEMGATQTNKGDSFGQLVLLT